MVLLTIAIGLSSCSMGFIQSIGPFDLIPRDSPHTLAAFAFDGSLTDSLGKAPFAAASTMPAPSYVAGRKGGPDQALEVRISNTGSTGQTTTPPVDDFTTTVAVNGGPFSIGFWERVPNSQSYTQTRVELSWTAKDPVTGSGVTSGYRLIFNEGPTPALWIQGIGLFINAWSSAIVQNGADSTGWHYIAVSWDLVGRAFLYFDGVRVGTLSETRIPEPATMTIGLTTSPFYSPAYPPSGLSGQTTTIYDIDDLSIYSGTLAAAQVKQLYNGKLVIP